MRRRIVPAAVTAALALSALTACTQSAEFRSDCANPLAPGALSNGVQVGEDGSVEVTSSVDIVNAQRTVIPGEESGARTIPGGVAIVDLRVVDAVTGSLLQEQESMPYVVIPEDYIEEAETALASDSHETIPTQYLLAVSLLCAAAGDTIVVGATSQQSITSGIGYNPTVFVLDVREAYADRAEGSLRGLPNGFPAVATNEDGRPGVVLPPQAPPSDVRSAPRVVGSGPEITADQNVIGQVLTVDWNGQMLTSTWDGGLVMIGSEQSPNPDYGFRGELNGYRVGSQVVILEPSEDTTLVHVVDIVAAVPGQG